MGKRSQGKETLEERDTDKRRLQEADIAEKRWQDEMKLKQQELDRQSQLDAIWLKEDKSIVGRTRKFAEAIKYVFPDFLNESVELLKFFDSFENLFQLYEIPTDLQSKLLMLRLSGKANCF